MYNDSIIFEFKTINSLIHFNSPSTSFNSYVIIRDFVTKADVNLTVLSSKH